MITVPIVIETRDLIDASYPSLAVPNYCVCLLTIVWRTVLGAVLDL